MHQQNACLSKFTWPLNQPGIKGFSIKHKYIQLGLYVLQ